MVAKRLTRLENDEDGAGSLVGIEYDG